MNLYTFVVFLLPLILAPGSSGEKWETLLITKLTEDYHTSARPVTNVTETINVALRVALFQIREMDMRNQLIQLNVWVRMKWQDAYLTWDPSDYGGLKSTRMPISDLWKPDILLFNSVDEERTAVEIFAETPVSVMHDGSVTWATPCLLTASCKVDIRRFPYDHQICPLKFGSWTYSEDYLNLTVWLDSNGQERGDLNNLLINGEWEVTDFPGKRHSLEYPCCPGEKYPDIVYYLKLERKPLYYNFNLVLPCVWLILVAILVFYIPPESGEKVSLAVTILLAMTVFLLIVADNMPPTSEGIPVIGQFFGATIILLSLSTSLTVVITNFHFSGELGKRAPRFVRKVVLEWMARPVCLYSTTKNFTFSDKEEHAFYNAINEDGLCDETNANPPGNDVIDQILYNVKELRKEVVTRNKNQDTSEQIKSEWQCIAIVIDRFFLIFYAVIAFVLSLAIFAPQEYEEGPLPFD